VGHHGSTSSTSTEFLSKVNPQVAIISVGAGNTYGHPAPGTLSKLQAAGLKVYRTDLNGNIVVSTDGKSYSIDTEKNLTLPTTTVITAPVIPVTTTVSTGKYVGSVKSNKYHIPTCRYAENINSENEIWFKDAAAAKAAGYVPCGVCKP